jgi:oxygen-independent coproporphyrinogen-3 oxidase
LQEVEELVSVLTKPFDTVYIGGGDPGLLDIKYLIALLGHITTHGNPVECTIEINPTSLREEHERLLDSGVNRFSIGLQSMQDPSLRTLGRQATVSDNLRALHFINRWKQQYPIQFNGDLMTCIPGQQIADALEDIDTFVDIADPDHISLYNLTIEEGTELARQVADHRLPLPSEDQQYEMLSACWDHLSDRGYHHYEISNFAKSGDQRSFHNQHYWHLDDYIGLGPSAAGTLTTQTGAVIRTSCTPSVTSYQKAWTSYQYETLCTSDVMVELILVVLRTADGIDLASWKRRFSHDFTQLCAHTIEQCIQQDPPLMTCDLQRCALTEAGFMMLDSIIFRCADELQSCAP